jgi:transposase
LGVVIRKILKTDYIWISDIETFDDAVKLMEYAFNVYKNDLEADRSYLRDGHMLFTYMFLNLLSLYLTSRF